MKKIFNHIFLEEKIYKTDTELELTPEKNDAYWAEAQDGL